ncbi:hypothetical protein V2J09_017582 [Rumex salicifolius]
MADQDYNRSAVGGTNWWDSSTAARTTASDSGAAVSTSCSSVVFPQDHSLQAMGLGLSSQPLDQWNHPLILRGDKAGTEMGGGGGGFRSMLQQGMSPFSAGQTQKLTSFLGSADLEAGEPEFKPIKGFSVDQQFLDTSSSSLYGNFQGLMGASDHAPPPQQQGDGYGYHQQQPDYEGLMGSGWTNTTSSNKVDQHHHYQFLKPNSISDPINSNKPVHSQYSGGGGGGSFWNMAAAAAAMADMHRPGPAPSSFFPVASPLIQQHQINMPCFDEKPQHNVMEVRDTSGPRRKTSGSSSEQTTNGAATSTGGTTNKRSRNEASSALPPFKVRKEKMGDRITALQQLVSPFGKTDTASVLSEAIEYIKFLHEQVNVLSTPYLKSGASLQHQQTSDKSKDPEGPRQDLRSRGLCLVPVSSTFPVAHETTVDFWTPTFGGTFRDHDGEILKMRKFKDEEI